MIKKLLLALLITGSAQAQIHFSYESELLSLVDSGKDAVITDLIKVHNHALRWIYKAIEDHVDGKHKLSKSEVAYVEYISGLLADVANTIGYLPSGMSI